MMKKTTTTTKKKNKERGREEGAKGAQERRAETNKTTEWDLEGTARARIGRV